jgi:hypothetical protein
MKKRLLPLLILFAALPLSPLHAVETVKSPRVEKGLLEIEQKGKLQYDQNPARNDEKEFNLSAIYGVTDIWKTKVETEFDQKRTSDFRYKSFKFENVLAVTTAKEGYWLDTALYQDITFADRVDLSHSYTFGFLARKDFGSFANLGNIFFKRDFGETAQQGTNLIARGQTRYSLSSVFDPAVEVYYDSQKRDALRDQSLKIGPAAFGGWDVGDNQRLGYEAGYFFGVTRASHDDTIKWKLKYEKRF